MSRTLGTITRADGTRHYFAHCSTSGDSFPRLFVSPTDARKVYGAGGDPTAAVPQVSYNAEADVVRVSTSPGWIEEDGEGQRDWMYGLATGGKLVYPLLEAEWFTPIILADQGGQIHIAVDAGGWFRAGYETECAPGVELETASTLTSLADLHRRAVTFCPTCFPRLSKLVA